MIDDEYEAVMLVSGTERRALVDSGAVNTLCGVEWFNDFVEHRKNKEPIVEVAVEPKNFRFGDGHKIVSTRLVTFPIYLCGKNFKLFSYIIEGDIPLLMSRTSLKEFGASIDFSRDVIVLLIVWKNL